MIPKNHPVGSVGAHLPARNPLALRRSARASPVHCPSPPWHRDGAHIASSPSKRRADLVDARLLPFTMWARQRSSPRDCAGERDAKCANVDHRGARDLAGTLVSLGAGIGLVDADTVCAGATMPGMVNATPRPRRSSNSSVLVFWLWRAITDSKTGRASTPSHTHRRC